MPSASRQTVFSPLKVFDYLQIGTDSVIDAKL